MMALDTAHQRIFTAWPSLARVDVLSTGDYHLIRSIPVPSPSTLDISPDGATLAVGTTSAHILFFDTATLAKTNDIVFPGAGLGITALVYTANGNAMIRADEGIAGGGGITAYWDHATSSFRNISTADAATTAVYQTTGPMARSGDYSKIMLGDATRGGAVQIVDANSGGILWANPASGFGVGYRDYIAALAANNDASRYAICVAGAYLLILDSNFNQLYQDQHGCIGMAFSADGHSLYRDVGVDYGLETQITDMATFTSRNVPNYFTGAKTGPFPTHWESADSTGMVYGFATGSPDETSWIAFDTSVSTTLTPPALDTSVKLVRVIDNIGSPQGGDSIRMRCTGVKMNGNQSISVTIGGASATNVKVSNGTVMPNEVFLSAVTPAGAPGLADVVLTIDGVSSTASRAFQYAANRTIIPFSTSPTFLLFDPLRNRLYASHKDLVEVIDAAAGTLLPPMVPASGRSENSKFQGLSLSPDGNRLYIADGGAGMIHILDLNNPAKGSSISVATALGNGSAIPPGRVFETSNGKIIGTGADRVFLIDPSFGSGSWVEDTSGNLIPAFVWNTTNGGNNAVITGDGKFPAIGTVGLWNANSSTITAPNTMLQWFSEASANEDGTVIAIGGSTMAAEATWSQIIDFDLYPLGFIEQHNDVIPPIGTPSFFLHPSGALLYKAGYNNVGGTRLPGGTVEIDDMHHYQPAASVAFPEPFISGNPFTDHMLTADPTGRILFGVTQSGITIITLNSLPLSIGNILPAFIQPQVSQTVTLRGSGFTPGATVSIGGSHAAATYVDPNTLRIDTPALASGWLDVTVTLPSGATYTAPSLLRVIAPQPVPILTGFTPAYVVVQSGLPGFDTADSITVLGENFESYDTIQINGQTVSSAFIDAGHMKATIPSTLTGKAGSVTVTVVSPYTGASNSLALPMINPIPVLQDNPPSTVVPGNSLRLNIDGAGFVSSSVLRWNGEDLPTYLAGGMTPAGIESVFATVPSTLTQKTGPAIVTVYNPPPGGGVSNSFTIDVSAAHPIPYLTLIGPNYSSMTHFYTFPTSIDFGTEVQNNSIGNSLSIQNIGTADYVLTSAAVSPGAFSLQPTNCSTITAGTDGLRCVLALSFKPTSAGVTSSTLTITDNSSASPHLITLSGTGIVTPVPAVTITKIDSLGATTSAALEGQAVVGSTSVAGTAWIEYGTDLTLATFSKSALWSFTGDSVLQGSLTNLLPGTQYGARLAAQTAGGTSKSAIRLFSTIPAWPWVTVYPPAGSSDKSTVTAGGTAVWILNAWDGGNGYVGIANFTCIDLPPGATCTISPAQISVSTTPVPITVTVTTTAAKSATLIVPGFGGFSLALCLLFGTGALTFRGKLRNTGWLLCLATLALSTLSCGGGSGGGGSTPVAPSTPTPPGIYSITVHETTGTAYNWYPLTLTVQ